jgi:Malonate decarboxylase, alpha subunit, transporter
MSGDGDPRHLRRHQVRSLNHGIGFDTAAIERFLSFYDPRIVGRYGNFEEGLHQSRLT